MATPDRFSTPQISENTRKPEWLKVRLPHGEGYERVKAIIRRTRLATVCEEARCVLGRRNRDGDVDGRGLHPSLSLLSREGWRPTSTRSRGTRKPGSRGAGVESRVPGRHVGQPR